MFAIRLTASLADHGARCIPLHARALLFHARIIYISERRRIHGTHVARADYILFSLSQKSGAIFGAIYVRDSKRREKRSVG